MNIPTSHSSGTTLLSQSWLVPDVISQSSGMPSWLQSVPGVAYVTLIETNDEQKLSTPAPGIKLITASPPPTAALNADPSTRTDVVTKLQSTEPSKVSGPAIVVPLTTT